MHEIISKVTGNFRDKNDVVIGMDDDVLVPEPIEGDLHICEFNAFVVDIFENGTILVQDGESDCFEIEASRLEVI